MTFNHAESSIDLNKDLGARTMGAEPAILLADARMGKPSARTAISEGGGAALPNATVTNDAPTTALASNTNPFNPTTFTQQYAEMSLINAAMGGQLGGPNYYNPNVYNGYPIGANPLMPGIPGIGRPNMINSPYNRGPYYPTPGGPYNGTSITFPLKATAKDFDPDGDGNLYDQAGKLINLNDPKYVKVKNPYNSANFEHTPQTGIPIDPVTQQPLSSDDPRMDPNANPDNPPYYLQIPNTKSVFNPITGAVLTAGDPNHPFAPLQQPARPNTRPNGGGGGGGGGGGMGGMSGLLRIGMMIGMMALLGSRGGGIGAMLPLMAMGMMGGMGGGGMMGSLLPMMLMGSLFGFGGGGSSNPISSPIRAVTKKR